MPKYEVIVDRTETFIFILDLEDEELARQYAYETIEEGNADPYFADWNFDITEKST